MEKIFIIEWNYSDSCLHTFYTEADAEQFIERYAGDHRDETNYGLHNLEIIKGTKLTAEVQWLKDSKFNVKLNKQTKL